MKMQRRLFALVVAILCGSAVMHSQTEKSAKDAPSPSVEAFRGRWDLTLKAPDREYPSWLELRQEGGQLKALMVGRWGSARPLPKVESSNGNLTCVSPEEEEDRPEDMVFEGTLVGNILSGTTTGPKGTTWQWTGQRAPALRRSAVPEWGKPIQLFNGKDLAGWKMLNPGAAVWTAENGNLVSPGNGPELINDSKFQDFK